MTYAGQGAPKCQWCHDRPGGCMMCSDPKVSAAKAPKRPPEVCGVCDFTTTTDDAGETVRHSPQCPRAVEDDYPDSAWTSKRHDYGPRGTDVSDEGIGEAEPTKMTRSEHVKARGGRDRKMSKHDGDYISKWSKKAEIHVAKALGVYNEENKRRIEALGADKGTDIVFRGWKIDVKWSPSSGEEYGVTAGGFVFDEDVEETPDLYVFTTTEDMVIRGWQWQKIVRALPSRVWSTEKDDPSHKVDYITLRDMADLESGPAKG